MVLHFSRVYAQVMAAYTHVSWAQLENSLSPIIVNERLFKFKFLKLNANSNEKNSESIIPMAILSQFDIGHAN